MHPDAKNSWLPLAACWLPYFSVCLNRKAVLFFFALVFLLFISWTVHFKTGMSAYKAEDWDIVQDSISFETTAETAGKLREPLKVLLLAYFRTGSTFTGELIQQTEGTFYVFEPFHQLEHFYLKKGKSPTLINGTKWPSNRGLDTPYQLHILESLFSCQIKRIDAPVLLPFSGLSVMVSEYKKCKKPIEECAEELGNGCLAAPIRIVKTIRTPMRVVRELLKKDPSVKVIHLLRDPRGHLTSWLTYDSTSNITILSQHVCDRINNDLKTRYELEKQYPRTFLEVIYEDLAQHPMEMLQRIYDWLGVPLEPKVIAWLRNSTNSDKEGKVLDTYRKNSTKAAYSWVKKMCFEDVTVVNKFCGDLISHGHFPTIFSEAELSEFTVPNRTLT